jgi:CcmD family protein
MKNLETSLRVRNERSNLLLGLRDCFSAIAMTVIFALMPVLTMAQDVEMADMMHENGKIYVVVGVIAIIFVGLVVYLVSIDRRLTKMEKEEK